jgi:hypothetical protein
MAIINNFGIGRDEIKRFRIYRGRVEQVTVAQASECSGNPLTVVGTNTFGERVSAGRATEFTETCAAYPGAIIHTIIGSFIWSQPPSLTYGISKNNVTLVLGTINQSSGAGGGGGGLAPEPEPGPGPPSDPNFGGETSVLDPDKPPPPGQPAALPSGNGNTGFGGVSSAGPELGITGGNT